MSDTIHTIRRSASRFLSGTLLSRCTGMFRDMSMAYVFGTDPVIAAFMVAFRLAHLLRRLFGEGAMQSAFIPEFEALRHRDEKQALSFFRNLHSVLALFLILLVVVGTALLGSLLLWADLKPANAEIVSFTLMMLPSLLFICLFGLNISFLQCEKSYFIPGVAPVAFNAIWIAVVLSLKGMPVEKAVPWLCFGVVGACFAQWLLTVPQTWNKIIQTSKHGSFLDFNSSDLRKFGKPLVLGMLGVAATQVNSAVDSLFARFAEPEGPAFLWFAIRIEQLPLALFGIAIAGAILPPLSRAAKSGDRENFNHFLKDALLHTWMFMLPLTGLLFAVGDSCVAFLYGRGGFDIDSSMQTTYCLWAYAIGLIPSALVLVLAPASYAKSNYSIPAIASFATMFLNTVFNTLFIVYMGWGAVSVAIATSISAWINFFYLAWSSTRTGSDLFPRPLIESILLFTLASCCALWGTYGMRYFLQNSPFFSPAFFSLTFYNQFIYLFLQTSTFCTVFFVCLVPCQKLKARFKTKTQPLN